LGELAADDSITVVGLWAGVVVRVPREAVEEVVVACVIVKQR
jgi:hypothetical protein